MPRANSGTMVVSRVGRFDGLAPAQPAVQNQVSPMTVQALAAAILQALANGAQMPVVWQPPEALPQQQESRQLERAKLRNMFD